MFVVVLVGAFATRDLLAAASAAESAKAKTGTAMRAAASGAFTTAQSDLEAAVEDLETARAKLATAWVTSFTWIPFVGADVRAARVAVDASLHLGAAGDDLLSFATADRPPLFLNRRLDPIALGMLTDALDDAHTEVAAARSSLAQAPKANLGVVADALGQLRSTTRTLDDGLDGAATLTERLLQATDGDDPYRVLVLFENGAELRATGGLMGFLARIDVVDGALELADVGPIHAYRARGVSGKLLKVPAPSEYVTRYGVYLANTTLWLNVNLSPHFPWVGQVAGDLYAEATGERADLVVRLDLTGVGGLLTAMPSAVLEDVPYGLSQLATDFIFDSYVRFPDNEAQNAYLAAVVGGVFARALTVEHVDSRAVLGALVEVIQERHLAAYSPDADIEAALAAAGADGALQPGDPGQVDVVVQNFAANKLDLFTHTTINVDLESHGCGMVGTVSTTLSNASPVEAAALPAGTLGVDTRWWVNTYLPRDATVLQILVDGEAVPAVVQTELNRPVAAKIVQAPPGESVTVTVRWLEPLTGPDYELRLQPQPMINPATLHVTAFEDQPFLRAASFDFSTGCVK